jgi:branched-chain amino acid transport system substrate-binding protein
LINKINKVKHVFIFASNKEVSMTTRRKFLLGAAATVGSLVLAGCGPSPFSTASASTDPIIFGISGPFTGDNAEYGIIWKNAFAIALDEINGKGGINGRKVQLDYEDSQADPKQSVPIAQKFANDPTILAELGDFASPASMAASPIYERAKMVQFGFTNSHPNFTLGGDFMFSTSSTQTISAADLATQATSVLKKSKQAVLYLDTDWGHVTEGIYVNKAKALGADVVAEKSYLSTEKDFRSILLEVRAAQPDIVSLISYYNDAALIVQQAKNVGIDATIIASSSAFSPRFISLAGNAANGVYLPATFLPNDPRPNVQAFVQTYQKRYKQIPDSFAEGAYDALNVLIWAVQKGGATRVGIQQALLHGTDIPSLQYGPFKFGSDRRVAQYKTTLLVVRDGQFVPYSG